MSKRSGHFVTLDSVIDEIGPDATRLLSLLNSIDQATTLDLDLVHAPVDGEPGVLRPVRPRPDRLDRRGGGPSAASSASRSSRPDLALLVQDRELELMRCLVDLPFVVAEAAKRSRARTR